jgi:hypothetical protein
MLFTTHAVVGAAIGLATGNPYQGFLLGVLSHHTIDALPHFDQGTFYTRKMRIGWLGIRGEYQEHSGFSQRDWRMLYADWALAGTIFLALPFFIPSSLWFSVIAGTLGGLAPDILDSSPLWSKQLRAKSAALRAYHVMHGFFHWTVTPRQIWLGVMTQVLLVGYSLLYIFRF